MAEISHTQLNDICDGDVYSTLSDMDDDPIQELLDTGSVTVKIGDKEIIIELKITEMPA